MSRPRFHDEDPFLVGIAVGAVIMTIAHTVLIWVITR